MISAVVAKSDISVSTAADKARDNHAIPAIGVQRSVAWNIAVSTKNVDRNDAMIHRFSNVENNSEAGKLKEVVEAVSGS